MYAALPYHPETNRPWNQGILVGQKRPLKLREVWAIRIRLQLAQNPRNLALFNLALDSKLRGCDLVRLRVRDVASFGKVVSRASIIQQKTQRPVQFEITDLTRDSLEDQIRASRLSDGDYLFPSRQGPENHLSTRQYARIAASWFRSIGLDDRQYGTHSLRRTKPTLIYRRTKNLRAVQLLLGHTKLESTVRYLGIEVEDALELAEQTDI